jgi:hypothetical protein
MKRLKIILILFLLLLGSCLKQNNEGYLEVVNHSTESITISGFGQGYETIESGDTSKVYTFDLGEYEHIWYRICVYGYYFSALYWDPWYSTYWGGYCEDACVHNGRKTTLNLYDYLIESSVTIRNHTSSNMSGSWNYIKAEDSYWMIDAGGLGRWDFNIPADTTFPFSFHVNEPCLLDTTVLISGGEHLNVNIYPE